MVTLFFLFQYFSEFLCPQASFYSDIYFLSFSFCSSCYFCVFSLLYSTRITFFHHFLPLCLSFLLFGWCLYCLSISRFICRKCNITKARFAVSAITEKQITSMHNIIRYTVHIRGTIYHTLSVCSCTYYIIFPLLTFSPLRFTVCNVFYFLLPCSQNITARLKWRHYSARPAPPRAALNKPRHPPSAPALLLNI